MASRRVILFALLMALLEPSQALLREPEAQIKTLEADVQLIFAEAGFSDSLSITWHPSVKIDDNRVFINCDGPGVSLHIESSSREMGPTLYWAIHQMGFYFPHPRSQISPTRSQQQLACGQSFQWRPGLKWRGFHLHTQHPSEWVDGFLEGNQAIAQDTVRWLARNFQNTLQVVLLKGSLAEYQKNLTPAFDLARELGLLVGVSASFTFSQQRSYSLVEGYKVFLPFDVTNQIKRSLSKLLGSLDFDFLTLELGTSEFTSTDAKSTIQWMQLAKDLVSAKGRQLFIKVHASTGQEANGVNFNFLPQFTSPEIGILPHTVMFYGIRDELTPVYGRKNFSDMQEFAEEQSRIRPTWYFPETSYFVAMDIDMPLLLTDYLRARAEDVQWLNESEISGQLNFSTGQELGYWLFDWNLALMSSKDYAGDPGAALRLLGEDERVWQNIMSYQTKYFSELQLIQTISSSTLLDELPLFESPHDRHTLLELRRDRAALDKEIQLLTEASMRKPATRGIKNDELRALMQVTWLRIDHALLLRRALKSSLNRQRRQKTDYLQQAKAVRERAQSLINHVVQHHSRYPESIVFRWIENRTSYTFGYGYTAATLHYWHREEEMIRRSYYSPFFMNIFNPLKFLF